MQVPKVAMLDIIVLEMRHQFMKNYNYLVVDLTSRHAVIVDPAWQIEKIRQAVKDAQAKLTGILITHSHPDHIHLPGPVSAEYDCPIWMPKEEIAASGFDAGRLI